MTSDGIVIRSCRVDDVPAVLELWNMAPGSRVTTRNAVEQLLAHAPDALIVAEASHK